MKPSWVVKLALLALFAGCGGGNGNGSDGGGKAGTLAGQVVMSGPVKGAAVAIDQLQLDSPTGAVRAHVGDATTDATGHFSVDVGNANGLFLITASGGSYTDLASNATVQLDAASQLKTITALGLLEARDDVLVSPIGHMIEARTRFKLAKLHDLTMAFTDATTHLGKHFGAVADWSKLKPAGLDQPAASPTEPVRAAFVLAALSYLAQDILAASGSSPQEVNVRTLTDRLTTDISSDVFDGDDNNDNHSGTGILLGNCPAVPASCVVGTTGCQLGACRTLCDFYAGTPRALLAGDMTKVIAAPVNKTGLTTADALAVATAIASDTDVDLFGNACIETLDRLAPTITWDPTPAAGAYVSGQVTFKATAVDDTDPMPTIAFVGYPDSDGDPTNSVATTTVDTTTHVDGDLTIMATAKDLAGNVATTSSPTIHVDNTAPTVTVDSAGFFVDTSVWWSATDAPTLHGTVTDASPVTVKATLAGIDYPATVTGSTFAVMLPAGVIDTAGAAVNVVATDAAGNQATAPLQLKVDLTPPVLGANASVVHSEDVDVVTFGSDLINTDLPSHVHNIGQVDLTAAGCPTVTKYSYLLDETNPPWVSQNVLNPLRYNLVASDTGVGLDAATAQFRVGRHDMAGNPVWVLPWTNITGTPNGASLGVALNLYRAGLAGTPVVPGLADADATYDVAFQIADRLGRYQTVSYCLNLKVIAPPLHWGTSAISSGNTYSLKTMTIGSTLAARLLNDAPTGASIVDTAVVNGTAETVYVDVNVPTAIGFGFTQAFTTWDAMGPKTVTNTVCPALGCTYAPSAVRYNAPVLSGTETDTLIVRVFQATATNTPGTEVPCANCTGTPPKPPPGQNYRFALAGRGTVPPAAQSPKSYIVMTMLYQSLGLRPTNSTSPAFAPFADFVLVGVGMTGQSGTGVTGCVASTLNPAGNEVCTATAKVTPYRTLTSATLTGSLVITTLYGTSQNANAAAPQLSAFSAPVSSLTPILATSTATLPPAF